MTAFLDFAVPSDAFALGRALAVDEAVRIDLAQLVPIGGTLVPYVWAETTDDEAFVRAVRSSPHVDTAERLAGSVGPSLFHVTWATRPDGLLDNLRRHELVVQRATAAAGKWRFKLIAEDRSAFGAFQSACREDGVRLDIDRVSTSADRDVGLYGLTAKQRDALLHVYDSGYYDSETRVGLSEVSRGLDINQQALSARLKRGTRALVANTIAVEPAR